MPEVFTKAKGMKRLHEDLRLKLVPPADKELVAGILECSESKAYRLLTHRTKKIDLAEAERLIEGLPEYTALKLGDIVELEPEPPHKYCPSDLVKARIDRSRDEFALLKYLESSVGLSDQQALAAELDVACCAPLRTALDRLEERIRQALMTYNALKKPYDSLVELDDDGHEVLRKTLYQKRSFSHVKQVGDDFLRGHLKRLAEHFPDPRVPAQAKAVAKLIGWPHRLLLAHHEAIRDRLESDSVKILDPEMRVSVRIHTRITTAPPATPTELLALGRWVRRLKRIGGSDHGRKGQRQTSTVETPNS